MSILTMNYPWPIQAPAAGFRQLDDGTIAIFKKRSDEVFTTSTPPPAGETRAARFERELSEGLVGYAHARTEGALVIETWVLFKTFRSPTPLSGGGWTGFEVRGVLPTTIHESFAPTAESELPTPEHFAAVVRAMAEARGLDPIVQRAEVRRI